MRKTYLSTAIPYVNANPHIGFALELVQADIYARYKRLLGEDVFFQTGADENSLKNVLSAEKEKKEVKICPKIFFGAPRVNNTKKRRKNYGKRRITPVLFIKNLTRAYIAWAVNN